jgi:hypothetical protein
MTEHAKPEKVEEPKVHAKAAPATPEETARRKAARKVLAEYRKGYDDPRDDDELMRAPYGAMEIADDDERHERQRAVKMERLAASDPGKKPKE